MQLINRQYNANQAIERWRQQYSNDKHRPLCDGRTAATIESQLAQLKTPVNPNDVDAIIGNDGWTKADLCCNECGTDCKAVVRVGEPLYYESSTALLCESCLRNALELITKDGAE